MMTIVPNWLLTGLVLLAICGFIFLIIGIFFKIEIKNWKNMI